MLLAGFETTNMFMQDYLQYFSHSIIGERYAHCLSTIHIQKPAPC